MPKFIELTSPNGHAILFNVAHIVFITPTHDGSNKTAIGHRMGVDYVTEKAKEILALIEP